MFQPLGRKGIVSEISLHVIIKRKYDALRWLIIMSRNTTVV